MSEIEIPVNWDFDAKSVADNFDAHVREQLPWYDVVSRALEGITRHYLREGGTVVDVGASTGNVGRVLADVMVSRVADYCAIEKSFEMSRKFEAPIPQTTLIVDDALTTDKLPKEIDVAVFFLVLSFVDVGKRHELFRRYYDRLYPGGAAIVVDKFSRPPTSDYAAAVIRRMTLAAKLAAGVDEEAIIAKELSLAGVSRPVSSLVVARFGTVEWFRFGEFSGYLIEREEI